MTFQVLEGKSRRGQRISMSIQFNPFEKRWEIFDESSTEDRHQMIKELLEHGYVAKYEDLKDILDRSQSSAERYIKQAIDSEFFKEEEWKRWKREAKKGGYDRETRIEKGKQHIEHNYKIHMNERGSGDRFIMERLNNYFYDECFEEDADF